MAFQLDVSGTPQGPCSICFGKGRWVGISDAAWHREGTRAKPDKPYSCGICRGSGLTKVTWSSLTPFVQGNITALIESQSVGGNHIGCLQTPYGEIHRLAYSDLAPETLARIMEDCAALAEGRNLSVSDGIRFWHARQHGLRVAFPPLTVIFCDDGKVRFAEQIAARPLAVAS